MVGLRVDCSALPVCWVPETPWSVTLVVEAWAGQLALVATCPTMVAFQQEAPTQAITL